ncbi:hypothetical protein [Pseudomonas sp. WCS374]|uniref:hypothetical protein n=1 Tax=Pseudomonas sp. WCS374 TaxID=1495331 RepID=UPI0012DD0514|nr:hypothetical protein [Pseudomonas sp. WCS374]
MSGNTGVQTRQIVKPGSALVALQRLTQNPAQRGAVELPGLSPHLFLYITAQVNLTPTSTQQRVVTRRQCDHSNLARKLRMLVEFDLNQNDMEALLRHCESFQPVSGDIRDDQRLEDALEALREALRVANAAR